MIKYIYPIAYLAFHIGKMLLGATAVVICFAFLYMLIYAVAT